MPPEEKAPVLSFVILPYNHPGDYYECFILFPLGGSKKVVNSVRAYAAISLSISAFAEAKVACA